MVGVEEITVAVIISPIFQSPVLFICCKLKDKSLNRGVFLKPFLPILDLRVVYPLEATLLL